MTIFFLNQSLGAYLQKRPQNSKNNPAYEWNMNSEVSIFFNITRTNPSNYT